MKSPILLKKLAIVCSCCCLLQASMAQDPYPCATQSTQEDFNFLRQTRNLRINFLQDTLAFLLRPADEEETIYFPVMHHIVRRSDGTGGPSIATIESAMDRLNDFYAEGDIQFYSCVSVQYIDDDALFDVSLAQANDLANAEDHTEMFNIYYFESFLFNGSTSWCGFRPGGGGDRIYMVNSCMDGWTLIHELGHYFSLMHTHGGWNCPDPDDQVTDELVNGSNCATAGDGICDTPADPNMGCGRNWVNGDCEYTGDAVDANGEAFNPLTNNVMSYGNGDDCRTGFTAEQWAAVRLSAFNTKSHLLCNPCGGSDLVIDTDLPASTDETFQALGDIFASSDIATGARVTLIARGSIYLRPGFQFRAGPSPSLFQAFIDNCTMPEDFAVVVP